MDLRLAEREDLPRLRAMFLKIIQRMEENGVRIWDEIYPCGFYPEDIEKRRLYLLEEQGEILSVFALCRQNPGAGAVEWKEKDAEAVYLDRFGVNADYQNRGLGGLALKKAAELAKEMGARYLRLFVVDCNLPAVRLYQRSGFLRAGGSYDEKIDDTLTLHEYGFEKEIR